MIKCSHAAEANNFPELLENDQLEAGGRREPGPDWNEALPEAEWALVLDFHSAVTEATVQLGVRWLVHKPRSNDVEWRDSDCHKESS